MLPEQMPPCPCHTHKWGGHGGSISPGLAQVNFKCGCGNLGMEISAFGCGPIFFISSSEGFPKEFFDYLNDDLLVQWRSMEEEAVAAVRAGETRWCPIPPRMPHSVSIAYRRIGDEWKTLTHGDCYDVKTPPDPMKIRHHEHWNGIFQELKNMKLLPPLAGIEEIKNQYYDDRGKEPWFTFNLHGATFVVGPRKRVVSIQVKREEAFVVGTIAELARQANTSYWADSHWHGWTEHKAREIEVHAWKREDVILYLQSIINDISGDPHVRQEATDQEAEQQAHREAPGGDPQSSSKGPRGDPDSVQV